MSVKKNIATIYRVINRLIYRAKIDDSERIYPLNNAFGYNRGTPIDRYYIKKALDSYSEYIKGKTLEVGDDKYTKQFGLDDTESFILSYIQSDLKNTVVGDLTNYSTLKNYKFDTFICTQTLNFIYDFKAAINTSYKLLNEGGYFIGTVASVSNISKYDNSRWGDYWRFTHSSIERSLSDEGFTIIDITSYGNVLAAKALFDGFSVEDLNDTDLLDETDVIYPVIISFLCKKV
jgi:hypothetical protein